MIKRVSEGDKINFFNEEALTTTLAQLALKFQLNIVPVFIERKNDDTFNIEFKKTYKLKIFKNNYYLMS